jgi:hypothetical protein
MYYYRQTDMEGIIKQLSPKNEVGMFKGVFIKMFVQGRSVKPWSDVFHLSENAPYELVLLKEPNDILKEII